MRAKKIFFLFFSLFALTSISAQTTVNQSKKAATVYKVKISTPYGDMVAELYNDTPKHRDNFLKLVRGGFYKDLLFHRVIPNFMIQGGDPQSKNAPAGAQLGSGNLGYTVPAEFRSNHFHQKGALCAARQGDNVNPKKASSASQFYIVQGNKWGEQQIRAMEQQTGQTVPADRRKVYASKGGTPFLDGEYTVFGQITSGLEVIDKIAAAQRDRFDRPLQNITFTITEIK